MNILNFIWLLNSRGKTLILTSHKKSLLSKASIFQISHIAKAMWVKIASVSQGLCQHPHSFSLKHPAWISLQYSLTCGDLKRCLVLKTRRWDESRWVGLWIFLEAGLRIQWGCWICAPFYFSVHLHLLFFNKESFKMCCHWCGPSVEEKKKPTQWLGIYSLVTLLCFFQICVALQSLILNPRSEVWSHSPEGHCAPDIVWLPW